MPKTVPLLPIHKEYLEKRGFNSAELKRLWRLKSIGLASKLAWRIFIPIHFNNETVSWTTRKIGDNGARYISAKSTEEIVSAKTLLYGEDYIQQSLIVCEGPTDAWRIGPGAVATMGISYTKEQVSRISKYPQRVICFDSELEAQKRARKLCNDLESFPGKTLNVVLDSKDPGSASYEEIQELRAKFLSVT